MFNITSLASFNAGGFNALASSPTHRKTDAAIVDDRLLVRTRSSLYAFGSPPAREQATAVTGQ